LKNKKNLKKFIRIHHISTDEVYGDLNKKKEKFCENSAYRPSSPYSATKAASDHLVRSWGRTYKIPYLITNCSNNYGSYQFPEKFIPHIILCILSNKKIPIYGNGKQVRDWIFVEDHVDILMKLMKKELTNETFNIGANNEISNINLVKKICIIFKKNFNKNINFKKKKSLYSYVPDRPGHDVKYAIDSSKIEKVLKYKIKDKFSENLKETILWYINNEKWWKYILNKKYQLKRLGKKNEKI